MTNSTDQTLDGAAGVTAQPSDNTTLTEVLAGYEANGFDAPLTVVEGGSIECNSCGFTVAAKEYTMQSLRRMEGASDPDDMVAAVAVTCPSCDAQGVLVLGYGPMASAEDSDVLVALQDGRGDDDLPPNSSPADKVVGADATEAAEVAESTNKPESMRSADVANGEGSPDL